MRRKERQNGQRGYVLGIVVVALVALSIGGVAILTLSGGEADLAGQVRRQKQLQSCALAGVDAAIARLPDTTATGYSLDSSYATAPGHYGSSTGSPVIGVVDPALAGDLPMRGAGENIVNVVRLAGLGSGALTRQPYRFVTTCQGPNGRKAEAEKIILFGGGR